MTEDQKKELFLSILAMDSYNQGYGTGIEHGQTQIGSAVLQGLSDEIDLDEWEDTGFFAAEYTLGDETIVSYRGTDNEDFWGTADGASDVWNGWISGAGVPVGQSALAFDFFEAVTGSDAFSGVDQGAILTGHSLGGGLAGIVASISGDEAVIFDNMPYAQVASVYALWHAAEVVGQSIISLFDGSVPEDFVWPTSTNITNYYLNGEVLEYARGAAHLIWPLVGAFSVVGTVAAIAVEGNAVAMEVQETTIELENYQGLLGYLDPVGLHSQQLKPIVMFGDSLNLTSWHEIAPDLYSAWFDKDLAETVVGIDGVELNGEAYAASKLRYLLAYSVLDEGNLVFGNTGIRAMFDDANVLGGLVADGQVPDVLQDAIPGLAEAIVQFAGQMALRKIDYNDPVYTDRDPEFGFLSVDDDDTILKVDLAKELWNLGSDDIGAGYIGEESQAREFQSQVKVPLQSSNLLALLYHSSCCNMPAGVEL